jgi:carbonic anhydrase
MGRGDLQLHGWVYEFETGDVRAWSPDECRYLPLDR